MAASQRNMEHSNKVSHILIIVQFSCWIIPLIIAEESHSQAYIQTDNELRYIIDAVPFHVLSGRNMHHRDLNFREDFVPKVRFEPPLLDFHEQAVGMPHMERVSVLNPDAQNSLHLLSISGSTTHFHCSFFQDKVVPPQGNTTFEVVFLARQIGNVENTLYIHTSQGSYKYQVFGIGVKNPYRIRPFLDAKIPLNSSFSPLIHLHNPHGSILQVEEVYTSGGDLHLELPTGQKETTKEFWEIPPYETRPIMKASFIGRIESNHTAFIRIITNKERKEKVLVLPVEVEVSSVPGIYSPLEMLDFGILRTSDEPRFLKLNLINSGQKPVYITNVTVSPPNNAVNIEFKPLQLAPELHISTHVALISFTACKAVQQAQWKGKIIVHTKNKIFGLYVPFQTTVLNGSLVFDRNKTMFYTGDANQVNITRVLQMQNTFNNTVVIFNVTVPKEAQHYITVNLNEPVALPSQKIVSPFTISIHPGDAHLHFTTKIMVHTNASVFNIPIHIYNGQLIVVHHRPEIFKGQLDFGTLGVKEKRSMTFTLRNSNPVDILIREFGANMDKAVVAFLGIEKGNGTTLTKKHNSSEHNINPLILKPFHYAVFSVNLVAPNQEGTFAAEVIIVTQFENLYIPMTLRTADGSLNAIPEKVSFENCFPGKLSYRDLKIHSSFIQYMEVRAISFSPNDTRFIYVAPNQRAVVLEPNRDNLIGKIYFDPKRECEEDCYVGLPTYIPAGHHWLLGSRMSNEVADTDQYLYTRFRHKWNNLGLSQTSTINVTIQLDTNQVRGFLFPAQAHLHWPTLAKKRKIFFPLTQVGNISVAEFMVENPGDMPVVLQILPLSLYPHPQTLLDLLPDAVTTDMRNQYVEVNECDAFSLLDLEDLDRSPNNPLPRMRKSIEDTFGVVPHNKTIVMTLSGGTKARVKVAFIPKDDLPRTTLIIIRNNLTILDTVEVHGQGGRGEMKFGNKKNGLIFDVMEKHLKSCERDKNKNLQQNFAVKRTFTAKNNGQLPFYVHSFSINSFPCEGFGFKVTECQGFELLPNSSKKIDIIFTPDFTMSRIRRTLTLHTSLGPPSNFTIQATVPVSMLTKCASALPRPSWEPIMYYSSVCILAFLLFCILVAAYFEADRIFTADAIRYHSKICCTPQFDKGKVLDLKSVARFKQEFPNTSSALANPQYDFDICESSSAIYAGPIPTGKKDRSISLLGYLHRTFFGPEVLQSTSSYIEKNPLHDRSETNLLNFPIKSTTVSASSDLNSTQEGNDQIEHDVQFPVNKLSFLLSNSSSKGNAASKEQFDLSKSALDDGKRMKNEHDIKEEEIGLPFFNDNAKLDHEDTFTGSYEKQKKKENYMFLLSQNDCDPYIDKCVDEDNDILNSKKDERRKAVQKHKSEDATKRTKDFKFVESSEKDETSSSTTESSSLDQEDKIYNPLDPYPEPHLPKLRKFRTKGSRKEKRSHIPGKDGCHFDEEFIITSKSRAHTKIRVDPKTAFGGSIHEPSSLELPYTIKAEGLTCKEFKGDSLSPPVHMSERKKNKHLKKSNLKDTPDADDLTELALQTEAFARTQSCKGLQGYTEPLTSSSRPSSYSSIVSNPSFGDPRSQKFVATSIPSPTNLRKIRAVQGGTHQHPGTIGPRSAFISKPMEKPDNVNNPWIQENTSGSFGLQPIQETHNNLVPSPSLLSNVSDNSPLFAHEDNLGQLSNFSEMASQAVDKQPFTMMQSLMADRRKRQLDYQQKILNGKDWPGFDMQMTQDSLWDSSTAFLSLTGEPWSTLTDSPPKAASSSMLWEPPMTTESADSKWISTSSNEMWCNEDTISAETSHLEDVCGSPVMGQPTSDKHVGSTVGGFDPFNTLGNIWNPSTSMGPGANQWNFSENKKEDDIFKPN